MMTTTLRPTGPVETAADGTQARGYHICVNGRPVGSVRLAAHRRFGAPLGRIAWLGVDQPDRRRGRATVAALAAEEVLRAWGCARVEVSVAERAVGAMALAASLGYTERNRTVVKRLPVQAPALRTGGIRPVTAAEYPRWWAAERAGLAAGWAGQGVPRAQAVARADAAFRALLPHGLATEGAALRVLTSAGADVGTLCVVRPTGGQHGVAGVDGLVLVVSVAGEHRGRGLGHTLLAEAERLCGAAGGRRLGLQVFAGEAPATRLATSRGYSATERLLSKPL